MVIERSSERYCWWKSAVVTLVTMHDDAVFHYHHLVARFASVCFVRKRERELE